MQQSIKLEAEKSGRQSSLEYMYGGTHYKQFAIQPVEFCYKNNIPYLEASAIKYICRHKNKGKAEDIKKARHFLDILLEYEYGEKDAT